MRQLIRPAVELSVCQRGSLSPPGNCLWRPRRLRLKQLVQADVDAIVPPRFVPAAEETVGFAADDRNGLEGDLRLRDDLRNHPLEVGRESLDRRPLEGV